MSKFEKLIEYIINEDEAKAKALFHQIVVEKSRDIYEGLQSSQMGAERLGNEIGQHENVVDGDEEGMHEAEDISGDEDFAGGSDEDEFGSDDEFGGDEEGIEGGDEFGGDEFGGEEGAEAPIEDRVMDLEDAIDELKAEFDQLMAGEEHEEGEFPGIHGEEGIEGAEGAGDEFGSEEEGAFGGEEEQQDESRSVYEAKKAKKDDKKKVKDESKEEEDESKDVKESYKSPADLMREYVEKVTAIKPVEGDAVGASGEKVNVNKKSTQIGGKNDMGGTTANIARGGSETAADGKPVPKASNYATKGQGDLPGAGKFENVPGAKAGQAFKKAAKPASKEGSPAGAKNTEGGKINDKSTGQPTKGKPGFTQAKKG